MRANELHVLLPTLQGSTVSGLLGMSLKPHTMTLSKPAQHLEELLGKGGARVRASPRARSRPNERSHGAMQAGSVAGPGKNPTCQ